jgi:hypothetical protein
MNVQCGTNHLEFEWILETNERNVKQFRLQTALFGIDKSMGDNIGKAALRRGLIWLRQYRPLKERVRE